MSPLDNNGGGTRFAMRYLDALGECQSTVIELIDGDILAVEGRLIAGDDFSSIYKQLSRLTLKESFK